MNLRGLTEMKRADVLCDLGCAAENVVEVMDGVFDTIAGYIHWRVVSVVMGYNNRSECATTNERYHVWPDQRQVY